MQEFSPPFQVIVPYLFPESQFHANIIPQITHTIMPSLSRRNWLKSIAAITATSGTGFQVAHFAQNARGEDLSLQKKSEFKLNYVLSSSMYGTLPIEDVVKEIAPTGSESIDIWPKVHANHREQIDEIGVPAFIKLLDKHQTRASVVTRYDLGPFNLHQDFKFAQSIGAHTMVCGGAGAASLTGKELKAEVQNFVEKLKPHAESARKHGITIAIENHSSSLINSTDSIRWLAEKSEKANLPIKIALAPYHLEGAHHQSAKQIAQLIHQLKNNIAVFYAWQYGMGCHKKLPKHQELLQLPGFGQLDFKPIIHALKSTQFSGLTSIFMHPVPRGIPIMPSLKESTQTILKAKSYLDHLINS